MDPLESTEELLGVHDLYMCKMKVKQRNAKLRSVVV